MVAAIACSFTYLIAQVTGVGLIVARFIGLDFNVGVFVGLLGVLFCSVLGGMRSVTWTQVAQYIILIISYLVPVVYLSWQLFSIPVPELTYGQLLQQNNARAIEITRDAKEKATRALWKKDADEANAKIKAGNLPEAEVDKLKAQAALATRQATAPAASDDATFGRYLTVPTGVGMWNFLALTFCLMVGTAGLPHILTRYYTTPSVRQARTSVAWSLFFIFLLYFTAPAYAAFARFAIYTKLVGTKIAELPRWVTLWQPAGLFDVVDKTGDGIVQWADFVVKSTDFVVLVDARDRRAAVRDHRARDGRRARRRAVHGRRPPAHDRQRDLARPLLQRHRPHGVAHQAAHHHQGAAGRHRADRRVGGDVPGRHHRRAGGVGLQPRRRVVLPGARHGHLVEAGQQGRRRRRHVAGLAVTTYYMIGSRFYGVSWFGTQTIASAIFGLPVGLPHDLDRLAAHGAAAAGRAGSRGQRPLSEVRAGDQGRSARPRLARSARTELGVGGSAAAPPDAAPAACYHRGMDEVLLRLDAARPRPCPVRLLHGDGLPRAAHRRSRGSSRRPHSPVLWFFGVVTGPADAAGSRLARARGRRSQGSA